MKKIMLVCSTSNYGYVEKIKNELEKRAFEVLTPNGYNKEETSYDNMSKEEYAKFFHDMFIESKNKIQSSDGILVLNYDKKKENILYKNYIGPSTLLEMYEACTNDKEIYIMNEISDSLLKEEIVGCNGKVINGDLNLISDLKKVDEYDYSVNITKFDVDWKFIKKACMTTISKESKDNEPSDEWKTKLLICEHSPIRRGSISYKWENIPYAISTHFARHHEGCEKFIGTQRQDRTNVDRKSRSQMNTVPMEMDANIQSLINISLKRLCTQADPVTRKYWIELLKQIREYDINIYKVCVPSCIYRGGCPELFGNCKFYENLMKDEPLENQISLLKRYEIYNKYRETKKEWK